jgi:hypothetical protein
MDTRCSLETSPDSETCVLGNKGNKRTGASKIVHPEVAARSYNGGRELSEHDNVWKQKTEKN